MPEQHENKNWEVALRRIEEARRSKATAFDLSDLSLTAIPESIGQLASLQVLVLYNNQLTALPESIGQLANLQVLDLSVNQISAIPQSLAVLSKLTHLFLHGNPGLGIPDEVLGPAANDVWLGNKLAK